MSASVSIEFLGLCQNQLHLLAQSVGASLSAVYIPEELFSGGPAVGGAPKFVPVAVYPEVGLGRIVVGMPQLQAGADPAVGVEHWGRLTRRESGQLVVPPGLGHMSLGDMSLGDISLAAAQSGVAVGYPNKQASKQTNTQASARSLGTVGGEDTAPRANLQRSLERSEPEGESTGASSQPLYQAVQPLYYNNQPLGLLVVARDGQDWQEWDYGVLEDVARTLSAACVLEQRGQRGQQHLQQLEVRQEQQQDILDNLLHQLRNPLTAIKTFGKLMLRRLQADDPNRSAVEGIVRESDRLRDLMSQMDHAIDDLAWVVEAEGSAAQVPYSSPDSLSPLLLPGESGPAGAESSHLLGNPLGGQTLVLERCELVEVLWPLLDSFQAIAQERHQGLSAELPEGGLWVEGNRAALREVISNLVENALKYSAQDSSPPLNLPPKLRPANEKLGSALHDFDRTESEPKASEPEPKVNPGHVVLWVDQTSHRPGWVRLVVADDGPGIPPQDLPHIFERHYRGVQAQGNKGGTGLGLAIVAALVAQMGGSVAVVSPLAQLPLPLPAPLGLLSTLSSDRPGTAFEIWLRGGIGSSDECGYTR